LTPLRRSFFFVLSAPVVSEVEPVEVFSKRAKCAIVPLWIWSISTSTKSCS
jgi:hypothetical protein